MIYEIFLFYLFLILSIMSALMVITLNNAVHAVLFLILTFCNITFLLLILGAEFFSFLLLIVYIGAIAVLFLFVIMMLNIKIKQNIKFSFFTIPVFLVSLIFLLDFIINIFDYLNIDDMFINQIFFISWFCEHKYLTNVQVIGNILYTNYCVLFIISSLILLIAMIGVIVLTMHQKLNVKKQKIEFQVFRSSKNVFKFMQLRI